MFTFWQALVELCTWDLLTIWRIEEHRLGLVDSFTKKYKVNRLMYYEIFRHADAADAREKQIKKYRREKKIALFAQSNPHWEDLSKDVSWTSKKMLM